MPALPKTLALIEAGVAQGLHVGAQLYVSLDGAVVADTAVGLARPATADRPALPMTPDTITLWLSAGKPLTAVATARLWEQRLLDLDDPVVRFIPEFAPYGKDAITVRHLLTHTAPLRLADTGWPHATWERMIQRICVTRPEPRWTIGVTAGYSAHVTWYILAEIVQRLSAQPIAAFLRDNVFVPCDMPDTYVAMTPDEQAANADRLAITQTSAQGAPTDLGTETPEALIVPRPSGSARGPARDLGHFYETLLARGKNVLRPQTVEAMTARHRTNTIDKTFGKIIDWGLGFLINSEHYGQPDTPYGYGPHASRRTFGHSGNQSSAAFADPERGLVAVVIFNGLPGEPQHQSRMRATLATLYEELFP